jgi:hypothetical protein
VNLLTSASQVARIAGVSHWHGAGVCNDNIIIVIIIIKKLMVSLAFLVLELLLSTFKNSSTVT